MPDTGYSSFDATVDKTNRILKEIEQTFGWPKSRRNQSYAALKAVLHALRDRLTVDEAAHFAAQLPVLVRGIYYHGWEPSRVPVKMNREQFLERVRQQLPFEVDGGAERVVQAVLQALGHHVTEGEWENVRSSVPRDLASLLAPAVH
jgi:uncharacterized protein (DUF2267 family)